MDSDSSDQSSRRADPALLHGKLGNQPGPLKNLFDRVRQLEMLERSIREFLNESSENAFRIANLRGDVLVVFCNSAAAGTGLRYQSQALVAHLKERHGLVLRRILVRVQPRYGTRESSIG